MFSQKKDESSLPDLPPLQTPFSLPAVEKEEIHALPSFPDSPTNKGFSQMAIKDAVSQENGSHAAPPDMPENEDVKVVEMKEWTPVSMSTQELPPIPQQQNMQQGQIMQPPVAQMEHPSLGEVPSVPQMQAQMQQPPMQMPEVRAPQLSGYPATKPPGVDVFVKIDKFHSAKKNFERCWRCTGRD